MKHIKKAAAILMAVVLSLCLAVTAFAADGDVQTTGTLTVTGSGLWNPSENKGKEVTAIRMFKARVSTSSTTEEDAFDSYELEDSWLAFFKNNVCLKSMQDAGLVEENATDDQIKEASVAYVRGLTTAAKYAEFAHNAQIWARSNSSSLIKLTSKQNAVYVSGAKDKTEGIATFTILPAGYYLVFPEGGSTGNALSERDTTLRGTDAMLVNVPKKNGITAVKIKSTFPTVDKQVQVTENGEFKDNGSAQVGDTVTFKLISKVPDMTDYNTYAFNFVDTLSKGLAYDENSVSITIGSVSVTTGFTVTPPTGDNSNKLTIAFNDLKKVKNVESTAIKAGDAIVVTYTAKITKDAQLTNPATNTVYLEYSNDPSSSGTGKSNPDESKVYTYAIDIHKFHDADKDGNYLANAVFQLKDGKGNEAKIIKLVADETSNSYHVKAATDTEDSKILTTVKTDETGRIIITGLKAGTYYLYETVAPTGYNKLTEPIEITISVAGEKYDTPTYAVDTVAQGTSNVIAVKNIKGTMLPETGSIGTIGLTALGVLVVLLGVFAPRKKKENH